MSKEGALKSSLWEPAQMQGHCGRGWRGGEWCGLEEAVRPSSTPMTMQQHLPGEQAAVALGVGLGPVAEAGGGFPRVSDWPL